MRNVILYIAMSLDGYIASPDGSVAFLDDFQDETVGDYGYQDFISTIDTCIMGSATYRAILDFGFPWPYMEQETHVITSNKQLTIESPKTSVLSTDITTTIQQLKQQETGKDIWLVGGGKVVQMALNAEILDQMILSVTPKLLGAGIRLFPEGSLPSHWELTDTKTFKTGMVVLTYTKRKEEQTR